ncbi:MAG: radical SAM protein [Planctomycetota bacterium]
MSPKRSLVGGGALPPSIRGEYLDRLEIVVEPLHDQLDSKTLRELHLVYNHYPPEDFSDFHHMKKMGIHSTSIDMEMVTSKAFKAICPGKHAYKPLEHWKEAQEAALGASLISATNIVAGIEPKEALLEGVHERLSKGVFPVPLQFIPTPNAPMAKSPASSAAWIVDVAERVADAYIRSSVNVTGPFGKAATMSIARKLAPKAIRQMIPKGWDVPAAAMPMSVNCVAFDELVRRVHRMPGGRFIPLPTAGVNTLQG